MLFIKRGLPVKGLSARTTPHWAECWLALLPECLGLRPCQGRPAPRAPARRCCSESTSETRTNSRATRDRLSRSDSPTGECGAGVNLTIGTKLNSTSGSMSTRNIEKPEVSEEDCRNGSPKEQGRPRPGRFHSRAPRGKHPDHIEIILSVACGCKLG